MVHTVKLIVKSLVGYWLLLSYQCTPVPSPGQHVISTSRTELKWIESLPSSLFNPQKPCRSAIIILILISSYLHTPSIWPKSHSLPPFKPFHSTLWTSWSITCKLPLYLQLLSECLVHFPVQAKALLSQTSSVCLSNRSHLFLTPRGSGCSISLDPDRCFQTISLSFKNSTSFEVLAMQLYHPVSVSPTG